MGNRLKKLIMFLVVVLGMTLFANEEQKAPNEIIKDNPEREVTTVESMKVRDHATMSLSVTKKNEKVIEGELVGDRLKVQLPVKGINENTLDRMAKPKEGKKLVVESKSKINPRMAKMVTKDIKKMPTQEEMNNLTVEQIQAMMSDTTDKKEEESQSKNVKNHIATENKEGIDVEILGVNKNEDIYVNVEENGQVVDRYRVAIANTAPRITPWIPSNLTGFLTNETVKLNSDQAWLISKGDGGKYNDASFPYLIEAKANHNSISDFYFKDEYFDARRSMKFKNLGDSHLFGVAFQMRRIANNNETNQYYATHVFTDGGTLINAEKVDKTKVVDINSYEGNDVKQDGYGYKRYYSKLAQFRMVEYVGAGGSDTNGFSYVKLSEYKAKNGRLDPATATGFLKYGVVEKVGFEVVLKIKDNEKAPFPGVYKSDKSQTIEGKYTGYLGPNNLNKYSYNHTARDIEIDVADEKIKKGSTLPPKVLTKTFDKQATIGTEDIVTDGSNGIGNDKVISFMSKNTNGNLGLWFAPGDGQEVGTRITPNKEYERIYVQEGLDQKFKVKVTQAQNNWAKIVVKPLEIHNPTSSTTARPKLEFTIVQGRRDGTYGVVELRRVKYTITYNRTLKPIGTMVTKIDPRLNQRANYWLTLGGNGGTDITILPTNNAYTGLFKNNSKWTESRTIKSINSVYKGNTKYDDIGKNGKYLRYGRKGTPYLGIQQILTNGNIIDTNKLGETNNFARKIGEKGTLTTYFTAANNSPFSFTHELKIEENLDLDRDNFTDNDGYKGNGRIDLTRKKVKHEYTLSRPQWDANETDNILHINNISGYVTIFAGLVEGQKSTEIVDSYKISVGMTELGTVTFGSNNQGVTTDDGALKIKLVKTGNVNNKRNIKLTKLEDIDFNKNIKIEYYHKSGIKLGEFTLTVTNTKTVTPIGTLTTTIDPRLAKLTTEEWISLGNYSGGTDVGRLENNKYLGLIQPTTNGLKQQKKIQEIITISKNGTDYSYITPDNNKYKRYGNDKDPKVAILQTYESGGIANTDALHTNANFARKVKDKGVINFEFKAGDNLYYSFEHNLVKASDPIGKPGEFTENDGYIGSANVNLSGKDIDTEYTLTKAGEAEGENQIAISGQVGWVPNFGGIVSEYINTVIVDHYKIDSYGPIYFDNNNGHDFNNFNIKLIKPTDVADKKNIKITKKNDNTYNQNVLIEYYHKSGIKLGEFTLTVNNTRTEKDLGESTVNIDPRIVQVNDNYSWIDLKNGDMFQLSSGTKAGNYTDFIGVPTAFPNATTYSNYNEFNLEKVLEINDSTSIAEDAYTYSGANYTITQDENEAAFPRNIKLKDFIKVDNTSKLIISKWDATNSTHDKNNKFLISGRSGNQVVAFKGNIKEKYLDKNEREIAGNIDKTQNIFSGSGTLNLAPAKVGTSYWFDKTNPTNGELQGNKDGNNKVVLKLENGSEPLNAAGILPKSKNKRVANKMVLTVNSQSGDEVNLSADKLEKELSIGDGKVKIAIDSQGRLEVTKTQEGDIPSTTIKIDYYYKPNGSTIDKSEIHLGTFTLTIENPVVDSSKEVTVKIDKRFMPYNKNYNWLFKNGSAMSDITKADSATSDKFSNFFTFDGDLDNTEAGTIQWGIGVEGRTYHVEGFRNENYKSFKVSSSSDWKDQAAVPNKGNLSNINDLVVVSKGNKDSNPNLNNRFSLLYTATSGNKYKIYRGNLKEEIVGDGKTDGIGTINLNDMEDDVAYEFKKESYNPDKSTATGESTGNKSLEMINVKVQNSAAQPLPDGKTASEISDVVIANKIIVNNNGSAVNKKTVSVDGIEFGIGTNGGLTVKKSSNTKLDTTKTYEIKFLYRSGESALSEIELSHFTLTIVGNEFELEPNTQTLDFGTMFYDSRDGVKNHIKRTQKFTLKAHDKEVNFSVANTSEMTITGTNNKIDLIDVKVTKKTNTSFELGATAVLDENTAFGTYNGEIQVIVDIVSTPSKP